MHMANPSGPRLRSSSYLYHYSHFPFNELYPPPPSFNYNKARWDDYHTYIDTHCPPSSNFITLASFEVTHTFTKLLNNAAPGLPFGSINRPAKTWWLPKSQMPSRNAKRHLQRHTVPEKTASTIPPLPDIPPL